MRISPTRMCRFKRLPACSAIPFVLGFATLIPVTAKALPAQNKNVEATARRVTTPAASPVEGPIESRIRVPSFKGVMPGQTTLNEVIVKLGEPDGRTNAGAITKLSFHVEPFERIDVVCTGNLVSSVVIHLGTVTEADQLATELQIQALRSAPVLDEDGHELGEVYPERGILFGYAESGLVRGVRQIILEQITAEPFILRAKYDHQRLYDQDLADLTYALKLDPENADGYWLLAKLHHAMGDDATALKHVRKALQLDSSNPNYLLTKAKIQSELGHHDLALQVTRTVLSTENLSTEIKARANVQLGNLLASGSSPDFKEAIEHHQRAIQLAVDLAKEPQSRSRRAAKRVLLAAHLGVAKDIALGQWRRKTEVVPKWLNHAGAIAAELIENEGADPAIRLDVHRHALATFVHMDVDADPAKITEAAIRDATEIVADQGDEIYHAKVARTVGDCLFSAATLAYRRDDKSASLNYGQQALEYLEDNSETIHSTRKHEYQLGCLYYLIGAIYANGKQNHAEAVSWYAQARPLLERAIVPKDEHVQHAERFVSMGVSYWHSGSRKVGLELSNYGARALQQAVNNNLADEKALIVPYGNLASMYSQMGEQTHARRYAQTAERLQSDQTPVKRR